MMTTLAEFDLMLAPLNRQRQEKFEALMVEHGLPVADHHLPGYYGVEEWYRGEYAKLAKVRGNGGGNVESVGVELDGEGARVCRKCGEVLVKKPGPGRWPKVCREGEGCKME